MEPGTDIGMVEEICSNPNLHEWIYQYILANKQAGGTLYRNLRCQRKRRKHYGSYDRQAKLPNRVSIEKRPAVVDQRRRIGN